MTTQASLTATVSYCYSVRYSPDRQRLVDAFPAGGFTIDETTLELQPLPVLKRKHDDHTTSNERRAARDAWRHREADHLARCVEVLIAAAPLVLARLAQLEQANKSTDEASSHE